MIFCTTSMTSKNDASNDRNVGKKTYQARKINVIKFRRVETWCLLRIRSGMLYKCNTRLWSIYWIRNFSIRNYSANRRFDADLSFKRHQSFQKQTFCNLVLKIQVFSFPYIRWIQRINRTLYIVLKRLIRSRNWSSSDIGLMWWNRKEYNRVLIIGNREMIL